MSLPMYAVLLVLLVNSSHGYTINNCQAMHSSSRNRYVKHTIAFARKSRIKSKKMINENMISSTDSSDMTFNKAISDASILEFQDKGMVKSKLQPLAGTPEAMQQDYLQGKSGAERYLEELLAPTPAGQEPKLVKLMKTITWGAVIVLVLLEIFVSIKVGGAPFDLSKVSLPALPSLPSLWPKT